MKDETRSNLGSQQSESVPSEGSAELRWVCFVWLWAFAQVANEMHYGLAFSSPYDIALSAGAAALLAFPSSQVLLASTGLFATAALYWHMPVLLHHHYFSGLTGLAVGLGAVAAAAGANRERALFAPLRWMAILLYFCAALHKMNPAFFAIETGCGPQYLLEAIHSSHLPAGFESLAGLGGWLGIGIELAIPSLLLSRKTRRWGVVVGALFHFELAVSGYPRFSALMVSLLFLFVDPARFEPFQSRTAGLARAFRWSCIGVASAYVVWKIISPGQRIPASWIGAIDLSMTVFIVAVCIGMATAVAAWGRSACDATLLRPSRIGLAVPALVVLSALAPYVGLGTLQSFSMYSNLMTEGNHRNHLFLGSWMEAFDYQRDLVEVRASSVPELQRYTDDGWLMPWVGFVQIVQRHAGGTSPVAVKYVRAGEIRVVKDAARDTELSAPLSWFERKLMGFRHIEVKGARPCTF